MLNYWQKLEAAYFATGESAPRGLKWLKSCILKRGAIFDSSESKNSCDEELHGFVTKSCCHETAECPSVHQIYFNMYSAQMRDLSDKVSQFPSQILLWKSDPVTAKAQYLFNEIKINFASGYFCLYQFFPQLLINLQIIFCPPLVSNPAWISSILPGTTNTCSKFHVS